MTLDLVTGLRPADRRKVRARQDTNMSAAFSISLSAFVGLVVDLATRPLSASLCEYDGRIAGCSLT